MAIQAIETTYKGYRFRSRLEARWAVFFDALGVRYEYEPQGFKVGDEWYLPDFHLPDLRLWVEIKGQEPTDAERRKCCAFSTALEAERMAQPDGVHDYLEMVVGHPWPGEYGIRYVAPDAIAPHGSVDEWLVCLICGRLIVSYVWSPDDPDQRYYHCDWCDVADRRTDGPEYDRAGASFHKGDILTPRVNPRRLLRLQAAFTAARGARFEHGEKP